MSKLNFNLTNDQKKALDSINKDLSSKSKMFRLLQGDVGSGKTIVALVCCLNVINSNFQASFMAQTEILAIQHYELAKQLFGKNITVKLLTSKTEYKDRKNILRDLDNNKINILIGTHSLFQEKIKFLILHNINITFIAQQIKYNKRGFNQKKHAVAS